MIKCTKNPYILVTLCKSLVCLHLEYCCSVWSSHYQKDKELLEKVQHCFTRMFKELKELDYYDRLQSLGLCTLEERRNCADLIEVFKLYRSYTLIPLERFFDDSTSHTRGLSLKLRKPCCYKNIRKYFFSVRVINRWNSLSEATIQSSTVNKFKNHLQRLQNSRMGFFMD